MPELWSLAYVHQLAQNERKLPRRRYQIGAVRNATKAEIVIVHRIFLRRSTSVMRDPTSTSAAMPIADASTNDGMIVCTPNPSSAPVAIATGMRVRGLSHGRSVSVSNHAAANSVTRMLRL